MALFRYLVLILVFANVFGAGICFADTAVVVDDKGRKIHVKQPSRLNGSSPFTAPIRKTFSTWAWNLK